MTTERQQLPRTLQEHFREALARLVKAITHSGVVGKALNLEKGQEIIHAYHDALDLLEEDSPEDVPLEQRRREYEARITDAERLDWYQAQHTLHRSLDVLYVVDGYELSMLADDEQVVIAIYKGATLRDAIDQAIRASAS